MKKFKIEKKVLESGEQIQNLNIAYQTYGELNAEKSNVIWVFHAISGDTNVFEWWNGLFGEGKLYDPATHYIICANCIGSPFGSTNPNSLDFPQITVRDQVSAFLLLANELNLEAIHTVIGGSFGGYQALEFTYSFTGNISNMVLLASSAKESAWGIAIHEAQRMALKADETFGSRNGGYKGLKAARALAMLTYRTSDKLIKDQTDANNQLDGFKASSYLNYQGDKFSEKFNSISLYYLTKCIDSHNIGRNRGGVSAALQTINIPTLVIGFTSDLLVPIQSQRYMAEHLPNAILEEIESTYGHDGFLMEHEAIKARIKQFYLQREKHVKRVILKFGGSSLYGNNQLNKVIDIIGKESLKEPLAVVVSARGKTTDKLIELFNLACQGLDFSDKFTIFSKYSIADIGVIDIEEELKELRHTLSAISFLKISSAQAKDNVLVFGELISAKILSTLLRQNNYSSQIIDARECIVCDLKEGKYEIDLLKSKTLTGQQFESINAETIPVITGFIASDSKGNTITLGRNGSNLSSSLFAQFLQAKAVQNWTDVDGIYSSDPRMVANAIKIKKMNYQEANELACFGMNLLHSKTILPLSKSNIPLHIRSTKFPEQQGTIIDKDGGEKGIKAVTTVDNVSLISVIGSQLKDNIGIDARIFSCLQQKNINVKMISQASTENGIGFIIESNDAKMAEQSLNDVFETELHSGKISTINIKEVGIIAIIGRHNYSLEKAIMTLRKNGIWMHLISNSISGKNISLVVDKKHMPQSLNLVHNEVYGTIRILNVFAIGKGKVGSEFIRQILRTSNSLITERKIKVRLLGVCDTNKYILNSKGFQSDWQHELKNGRAYHSIDDIIIDLKQQFLNDIIIVDNTASDEVSDYYEKFIRNNFNIVASNKTLNSGKLERYINLQKALKHKGKSFYYETNVGAGLPIMALLRSLNQSSDRVNKIKGVFSGSLSYIFNNFSKSKKPIDSFIQQAIEMGLAEPDPRLDLNGMDVGRKLIILARELKLDVSIEDVKIKNLVPEPLRGIKSLKKFYSQIEELNNYYDRIRSKLGPNEVIRYVAELDVNRKSLTVDLINIKQSEPMAQIKNADNYFEIYSESYKENPIILQGKGAGPVVTAKGVYSDVLKVS